MASHLVSFLTRIVVLILLSNVAALAEPEHSPLRGQPFTEPAHRTEMPATWNSQPIEYKAEAVGADIAIDINQQLLSFLLPMVEEYGKTKGLRIITSRGTCGKSFGQLNRKQIDIGMSCCPPGELDRLPGLRFHTIGIMPLALLVNNENPVNSISLEQARAIFQGKIRNWSSVGGADQTIKPVSSFHCRVRPGHWRLLLDNEDLFGPNVVEVGEMSDMIYHLAANPLAIGYEVMLVAELFKDRGEVKPLSLNGHGPGQLSSLLTGNYPLYRTFNITTWDGDAAASAKAVQLVDYIKQEIEKRDVAQYGLISADKLRKAGWRFSGPELVGEPL